MSRAGLKRVLILTYFFPPCNLTASQRSLGWAKYLNRFGYYPIIITRNWEKAISSPADMHHDSGTVPTHEVHDGFEIWYVPFKGNLRDKLYARYGNARFKLLRKALSFAELIAHHFITAAIPFKHLYYFADEYLKKHKGIHALIVTGNPFEIFRFGYLLNKKHQIPWIADYRDDWNTSEVNASRGMADQILRSLERNSERKYMQHAFCITSVSKYYADKIGAFVARPGKVILNGFVPEDFEPYRNAPLNESFTIVYNGMLYPSQQIELFLEAVKMLVDQYPEQRHKIRLQFPGILFLKESAVSVKNRMTGYEDILEMSGRVSREEVLKIQAGAHLLLMVAHTGRKGIPSSKIYEYLALGKPVLVCPGDGDILDETFKPYNLGHIAETTRQAFEILDNHFNLFLQGNYQLLKADTAYTARFSREIQTAELAKVLDQIHLSTADLSTGGS